jgi:hypothetical protein
MRKIILAIIFTLVIIYAVPFVIYSILAVTVGLKPSADAPPSQFLIGVLVSKTGTAIAFVLIFYFARDCLTGQWLLYALLWWLMFAIGEVGQAIGPNYSWMEAVGGIISEAIYLPLAALVTKRMLTVK